MGNKDEIRVIYYFLKRNDVKKINKKLPLMWVYEIIIAYQKAETEQKHKLGYRLNCLNYKTTS